MSAQTGVPALGPPPPSSTRIDRARLRIARYRNDPNPVWMRELRQSARLQRTPVILAVVTCMMTLLIASIGGVASATAEPASVGVALFQTFFSLAFFGVTWFGPTVAASTIASERSGRTWEALLLTGLRPKTIARGKFAAAITYVCQYLVMLAPVGAMPFLFGGVTATEVVTAFLLLALFAVLSVAFGLSVSSKFKSPAAAIVVTLLVAVPLSIVVYLGVGVALSFGIHELWPSIGRGTPVWLPTAYVRADFGALYLVLLVLAPLGLVVLPAWFLYEVTVANMSGLSDDRSSGIRRWFLVSCPLTAAVALAPALLTDGTSRWVLLASSLSVLLTLLVFATFVFMGEPIGPSRRVLVHWERSGVGWLRRYLGPGLMRAMTLLLGWGLAALLGMTLVGAAVELGAGGPSAETDALRIVVLGGYLAAFLGFVVGFAAITRARLRSAAIPRILLLAALFLVTVGPWIAMAIAGVVTEGSAGAIIAAAPSPTFVFRMMAAADPGDPQRGLVLAAGGVCAGLWALLGLGLLLVAALACRKVIAGRAEALERLEAILHAEDTAEPSPASETPAAFDAEAAESPEGAT